MTTEQAFEVATAVTAQVVAAKAKDLDYNANRIADDVAQIFSQVFAKIRKISLSQ